MTTWQKFAQLGERYREAQLDLLKSACPESMAMKELAMWGKLCSKALQFAHRVELDTSQAEHVRKHWAEIRSHSVLQLQRIMSSVEEWQQAAEEVSVWERCQIFELLELCSRMFQEESNLIQLAMSAKAELSEVPSSVSSETLAKLAQFAKGDAND